MAFRMPYGSRGLIGYTMKIIRGAARIATTQPRETITLRTLAESYSVNVWAERLDDPNPFLENFDPENAPPVKMPSKTPTVFPQIRDMRKVARVELGA
jgi:hypothetical protein